MSRLQKKEKEKRERSVAKRALGSMLLTVLWTGWSMVVFCLHSSVYRSVMVTGKVVFTVEAGTELGLPS